jgi:hypothetical protein
MSVTGLTTITRRNVLPRVTLALFTCLCDITPVLTNPQLASVIERRMCGIIELLQVMPASESLSLGLSLNSQASGDKSDE